ncbi:MAG TPA: hypothetical protein VMB72_09315 [Acidimicrobiales bacterium]|nr:hypothetical protein [Acidimicrobiales bacterium]
MHVETQLVNASTAPQVHRGRLTRSLEDLARPGFLYEVGTVSYNLSDLPEDMGVEVALEPVEHLEMTFDDGTSLLIKVVVTAL